MTKELLNLNESGEGYIVVFEGGKENREMLYLDYNLKMGNECKA